MTEYEKMRAGEWIVTNDPEIVRRNREATRLWREFSQTGTDDESTWRKAMRALLPNAHPTAVVKPPFRCDFGTEIYLGEKAFVNFNCTILDWGPMLLKESKGLTLDKAGWGRSRTASAAGRFRSPV